LLLIIGRRFERDETGMSATVGITPSLGAPPPPSYRLAVVNHGHRQSRTVSPRPDVTSREVHRAGSRGVEWAGPVRPGAWACEDERVRMVAAGWDRELAAAAGGYQSATVRSSRSTTAASAAGSSLPRELGYEDRGAATARSRLFSALQQFHESSYSAPADCTAPRRPRGPYVRPPVAAGHLPSLGPGVRAARVSERTEYHLTSTRPTAVTSSGDGEGQRSRSSSGSRQGASLWVGVAQMADVRPVSATALTATVDRNNRKPRISYAYVGLQHH